MLFGCFLKDVIEELSRVHGIKNSTAFVCDSNRMNKIQDLFLKTREVVHENLHIEPGLGAHRWRWARQEIAKKLAEQP